jgi:hypothetical protein
MRVGLGHFDDVAEKFLQTANAAEHALGGVGKARLDHGLELRQPAPDVGQAADRVLGLEQARAPPQIENGAVEDDIEFTPSFPRSGAIPMRYLGVKEEKIARAAWDNGEISRFHPPASLEQIDERVTAISPQMSEGNAAAVANISRERNLAKLAGGIGLQEQTRATDSVRHTKTYMFFTRASIWEKRPS